MNLYMANNTTFRLMVPDLPADIESLHHERTFASTCRRRWALNQIIQLCWRPCATPRCCTTLIAEAGVVIGPTGSSGVQIPKDTAECTSFCPHGS
jgi:hypothetical protein